MRNLMRNQMNPILLLLLMSALSLTATGCGLDGTTTGLPIDDPYKKPPIDEPYKKPPVDDPPTVGALCPSLGLAEAGLNPPLFVFANGNALDVVHADGKVSHIELPMDEMDPDAHVVTKVHHAHPYLAVSRDWGSHKGLLMEAPTALTVVDMAGDVLWHMPTTASETGYRMAISFVHSDGSVLASKIPWPPNGPTNGVRFLVASDGTVTETPGFELLGHRASMESSPYVDVIAARELTGELRYGWYLLPSGGFLPWTQAPTSPLHSLQDHLFWLVEGENTTELTVASPLQAVTSQPIAGIPYTDSLKAEFVAPHWLFIRDWKNQELWRVQVEVSATDMTVTGDTIAVDLTPPEGLTRPNSSCGGIANGYHGMDQMGRLLLFLRDAEKALAYRLDPETQIYEAIGAPMSHIDSARIWSYGDTYAIQTLGTEGTFCQPQPGEWDEPGEGVVPLQGSSSQVVHPNSGNTFVGGGGYYPHEPAIHHTGLCFVAAEYDPKTKKRDVHITDVLTGTETPLLVPGVTLWLE